MSSEKNVQLKCRDLDIDRMNGLLCRRGKTICWWVTTLGVDKFAKVMEIEVMPCDYWVVDETYKRKMLSVGGAMLAACRREGKSLRWLIENKFDVIEDELGPDFWPLGWRISTELDLANPTYAISGMRGMEYYPEVVILDEYPAVDPSENCYNLEKNNGR